jgi:hypothetical protein
MADVDINGKEVEAKAGADFGHPLMDKTERTEEYDHHHEAAKTFLSEDLPDYAKRVASLAGRPEAAGLIAWIKEQAKDEDNVLFRLLEPHTQSA